MKWLGVDVSILLQYESTPIFDWTDVNVSFDLLGPSSHDAVCILGVLNNK